MFRPVDSGFRQTPGFPVPASGREGLRSVLGLTGFLFLCPGGGFGKTTGGKEISRRGSENLLTLGEGPRASKRRQRKGKYVRWWVEVDLTHRVENSYP